MATLRRLSYTVINIWCPYGNIAKIALCRYKYLMSIWIHCEDRLIPLYIFDVHMATLRTLSYTVINTWCPYVNIAKIALCRYKYLMSIWLHCEDDTVINIWCPYGNIAKINIWCPYGNIAKIALCRYKYLMSIWIHCEDRLIPLYIFDVHMATLRTLSYTVINTWCPYVNIAKIALCRYKYLMSIWLHCEDRLIPL